MNNPAEVVRLFLLGMPDLTEVVGTRIYGPGTTPAGIRLSAGSYILISVRGGSPNYSSSIFEGSLAIRCFARSDEDSSLLSDLVFKSLNDRKGSGLKWARLEDGTFPVPVRGSGESWPHVISYYQVLTTL